MDDYNGEDMGGYSDSDFDGYCTDKEFEDDLNATLLDEAWLDRDYE